MNRETFWSWYNRFDERPIDTIVTGSEKNRNPITPEQVVDFYSGCRAIHKWIQKIKPNIMIYPLRGAGPLNWTLNQFDATLDPSHLGRLNWELRLGHTNSIEGDEFGTKNHKREIIQFDMARMVESPSFTRLINHTSPIRVALVDEVQSGSTLSTAAGLVAQECLELGITDTIQVIGAHDSRVDRLQDPQYTHLLSGGNSQIVATNFDFPLFFIDREELLDFQLALTNKEELSRKKSLLGLHILRNIDSRRLFENLGLAYIKPNILHRALTLAYSEKSVSWQESEFEEVRQLYDWIIEIFRNEKNYPRKASNQKVHHWLKEFGEIAHSIK